MLYEYYFLNKKNNYQYENITDLYGVLNNDNDINS